MTPQQIKDKLTFGDRVVFKRYQQPDQVLYYKNQLNDKQGYFTTGDGLATYAKYYKNISSKGFLNKKEGVRYNVAYASNPAYKQLKEIG
jgi:hypothetical protein